MVGRNFREHPSSGSHTVVAPNRQEVDFANPLAASLCVAEVRPDIIVHAAGKVAGIAGNLAEPTEFFLQNLHLGINVVESGLRAGVRRVINLGSSCIYPRGFSEPLTEEMLLKGELEPSNEGYALAKIAIARLCAYVSRQYPNFSYKTLIPCNLYGRFDNFDAFSSHMMAAAIRKIHEAKTSSSPTVTIWGDGTARREFLYAGDLADCLHRAIESFESLPNVMNVGVGTDRSVLEYYGLVADVLGYHGSFVFDQYKPAGMQRKLLDVTLSRKWGWVAKTPLAAGIRQTYDYFLTDKWPQHREAQVSR
jgi:GDP-L-fucose synthase